MDLPAEIEAPLALHEGTVRSEWIDYNGHMNVAFYLLAFDHATDDFFDYLGLDEAYRISANASTFAVEGHITYARELHEGDPMRITTQVLGHDEKRLHYFHRMYHGTEGFLASTLEMLSLHVDMGERRVSPFPPAVLDRIAAVQAAHEGLGMPEQAGHVIRIPMRKA